MSFNDSHQGQTHIAKASGQLPEFIKNDQRPPDSPEPWKSYHYLGRDVSQAPSNTQINHRTQRSDEDDLGQHVTGTDQHCWMLKASHSDWRGLTVNNSSTQSDCQKSDIVVKYRYLKRKHCVVAVTLFCSVSAQTFSARENRKVVTKISITSSFLNIIKCHLAVQCR